jgi:hypothetical protein
LANQLCHINHTVANGSRFNRTQSVSWCFSIHKRRSRRLVWVNI